MNSEEAGYLRFETADDIWLFVEEKWAALSSAAIERKGSFAVALSGGKTPIGFYQHLSSVNGLPWDRTHIFLVDERLVPAASPESNFGMIRRTLTGVVPVPPSNVHPMFDGTASPSAAVEFYEKELRSFFCLAGGATPEFDLILLGIGEDGHTASLFPGSEALKEKERLVVPVPLGRILHDRITLTLPVINGARNVFFLVCGRRKKVVIRKLRQGHDRTMPAAMVKPVQGNLVFLTDNEAAG
jgi:6-phosphogluconolactonase